MAEKKYFSVKEVANRYGVSVATIWRWASKDMFPKPIQLSPGCSKWELLDLENWEQNKRGEVKID